MRYYADGIYSINNDANYDQLRLYSRSSIYNNVSYVIILPYDDIIVPVDP